MIVYVDVDSTIADLMPEWLRLYNFDYGDSLSANMITDWAIDSFVKPECGIAIYDYLKWPNLYDNVEPIDGAISGVRYLRSLGHRIIFASAGVHSAAKFEWLERHGFEPGERAQNYIVVYDKSLLRGDLLIDDKPENLYGFKGHIILYDQPWNQKSNELRASDWHEVTYMVRLMKW